jgi:hypothetical protein
MHAKLLTNVAQDFSCAVGFPKCKVLVISVVPSKYFTHENWTQSQFKEEKS